MKSAESLSISANPANGLPAGMVKLRCATDERGAIARASITVGFK